MLEGEALRARRAARGRDEPGPDETAGGVGGKLQDPLHVPHTVGTHPDPRWRRAASAVALARLASHLGGLLDALGSLAGTQARDLRAGTLGFRQTGTQCLHEIDDLAFAL